MSASCRWLQYVRVSILLGIPFPGPLKAPARLIEIIHILQIDGGDLFLSICSLSESATCCEQSDC